MGNKADDIVIEASEDEDFYDYISRLTNYDFHAKAELKDEKLILRFNYGKKSLKLATRGNKRLVASLPSNFSFYLINDKESKFDYMNIHKNIRSFTPSRVNNTPQDWMINSEMTITRNNIKDASLKYNVIRKGGPFEMLHEESKYDFPEKVYDYTEFEMQLQKKG